ncbi:MAG: GltJ [Hyphomicrobiales bacterium]|nr:GltJ [Hyphomicrobiales bacterium]
MVVDNLPRLAPAKVSLLNDPKVRGIIYQAVVAIVLVLFVAWVLQNVTGNLTAQKKTTGFGFLFLTAGFDIGFSLIPYSRSSLYWQAFLVGLTNTLLVASIGIVLATLLGFTVGIARLSSNFIIAKLAAIYIDVIRNIPLLLQLFFWYFAVLKGAPAVKQSLLFFGGSVAVNQRGIFLPRPLIDDKFVWVAGAFALALIAGFVLRRWARARQEATGQRFPVLLSFVGLVIVLPTVAWLTSGTVFSLEIPQLAGFNFKGGLALPPELCALLFGLVIYTATFIAEIVRAGILAVNHGQSEAAQSLGLKESDRLRLVILPQALRVIIPPLTSQYLNLTKNSSLGAFIGFPELVNVFAGTTLNQTGRAIEVISLTMLVYLTFSLTTSAFMNWYNARVALKER